MTKPNLMDKNTNSLELVNDRGYWKATVNAVDDYLPTNYINEVLELLKDENPQPTPKQISDVRLGRNKGNRLISKAIHAVGLRYQEAKLQVA